MKISAKLTLGFAIVVGLIVPTALFSLYTYHQIHEEFEALKGDIVPGAVAMMEMESTASEAHRHLMEYLMHEATKKEEEQAARSNFDLLRNAALKHLKHKTHIGAEEKAEAEQLVAKVDRLASAAFEIIDMEKRGASFA
ncbi:MAG: MCP four helix bundle domain-containing protein, partial [Deltaproteobacteria bacterium]|nr:MCP four helix bundle domain-containing protein [Deltaproteobacteria bacterium]